MDKKGQSLFIDAHLHVNHNGITSRNLISHLDRNRIDQCWLLTWEEKFPANPMYSHLSVENVFEMWSKYPSRIIPMYAPDPVDESWVSAITYWVSCGFKGIGELKVMLSWYSTEVGEVLDLARTLKLPVLFHMEEESRVYRPLNASLVEKMACKFLNRARLYPLGRRSIEFIAKKSASICSMLGPRDRRFPAYLGEFSGLEKRLKEYPDVVFIGHGPLFWKGISSELGCTTYPRGPVLKGGVLPRLLEEYPNLYADISGVSGYNALQRDKKFTQQFLSELSSKILFGTDNVSLDLKDLLKKLRLNSADIKKIFGENAMRIIEKSSGS